MEYYNDPTAWIAIANVEREENRAKRKHEPKKKKEYSPRPPVDAFKVIHAKNKRVNINAAYMFMHKFKKALGNENTTN